MNRHCPCTAGCDRCRPTRAVLDEPVYQGQTVDLYRVVTPPRVFANRAEVRKAAAMARTRRP